MSIRGGAARLRAALAAGALLAWLASGAAAQVEPDWARFYDGPSHGFDDARTMTLDSNGNACVVGSSDGIGTGKDIAVVKYDPAGNLLWAARYDGADGLDDWAYAAVLDSRDVLYVAGETGTPGGGSDFTVVQFDPSGAAEWVYLYDGPAHGRDVAFDLALEESGGVFATGSSEGVGTGEDYVTIRLGPDGTAQWVKRFDGAGHATDQARTLAFHGDRVYVSGGSVGEGTDFDFLTLVYDKSGRQLWTAVYDGPASAYDMVYYQGSLSVDALGSVYVCGYSTGEDDTKDYAVIKYDATGAQRWTRRLAGDGMGNDDFANRLCLDDSSNVYVTGALYREATDHDIATVKYNSAGEQQWIAVQDGTAHGWDEGYDVLPGRAGEIYVLGRSPGTGGSTDFLILEYDSAGTPLWDARFSRAAGAYSWPFELERGGTGELYAAGWSFGTTTGADFTLVKYTEPATAAPDPSSPQARADPLTIQIRPNPFRLETSILYRQTEPGAVRAVIYDVSGRAVRALVDGFGLAGEHRLTWDGTDRSGRPVPAGVYWCALQSATGARGTEPVILVR